MVVVERKKEKHRKKENAIKDAIQIKSADPANLKKEISKQTSPLNYYLKFNN